MAVMSVYHPDIIEYIEAKSKDENRLKHFNLSVMVDDDFMKDKIEQDKLLFEDIDKAISEIYKDVIYEVNYNTINFNTVMNIVSPKLLSNENILKLCSEYSEKYHIEFENTNNKQIINIHLKNLGSFNGV